jgi:hypothetical protein
MKTCYLFYIKMRKWDVRGRGGLRGGRAICKKIMNAKIFNGVSEWI